MRNKTRYSEELETVKHKESSSERLFLQRHFGDIPHEQSSDRLWFCGLMSWAQGKTWDYKHGGTLGRQVLFLNGSVASGVPKAFIATVQSEGGGVFPTCNWKCVRACLKSPTKKANATSGRAFDRKEIMGCCARKRQVDEQRIWEKRKWEQTKIHSQRTTSVSSPPLSKPWVGAFPMRSWCTRRGRPSRINL